MLIRVISSIIALPILFFFVLMGGISLEIGAFIATILGIYEFFSALKKNHYKPFEFITYVLVILVYVLMHFKLMNLLLFVITLYIVLLLVTYLFNSKKKFVDVGVTLTVTVYVLFFLYHAILLSNLEPNFFIWYIFIVSWGADTGAYFIGVTFGNKKLMPSVSPSKSVEGAIGGIIFAIVFSVVFTYLFDKSFIFYGALVGLMGSVISIIGDLVASRIKREMNVKDFGNIMPGHGGLIDRFDSLLLVTPFVYYLLLFIIS